MLSNMYRCYQHFMAGLCVVLALVLGSGCQYPKPIPDVRHPRLYPGATILSETVLGSSYEVASAVAESCSVVRTWYADILPQDGWQPGVVGSRATAFSAFIPEHNNVYILHLSLQPGTDATECQVRVRVFPSFRE